MTSSRPRAVGRPRSTAMREIGGRLAVAQMRQCCAAIGQRRAAARPFYVKAPSCRSVTERSSRVLFEWDSRVSMSRGDRAELAGASVSSVYARCSCALFGFAFATAASMCCVFASGSVGERSVYALRVRERSSVGIRERSVCARVFASVVRLAFASAVSVRCVFASAVSVCACSRA
jgi:hypothetical protein